MINTRCFKNNEISTSLYKKLLSQSSSLSTMSRYSWWKSAAALLPSQNNRYVISFRNVSNTRDHFGTGDEKRKHVGLFQQVGKNGNLFPVQPIPEHQHLLFTKDRKLIYIRHIQSKMAREEEKRITVQDDRVSVYSLMEILMFSYLKFRFQEVASWVSTIKGFAWSI